MFNYYRRQNFSFSDPIMFYITENKTSAKTYEKLIKTCKHFYAENPMIPMCLHYFGEEWVSCSKKSGCGISPNFKVNLLWGPLAEKKIWLCKSLRIHSIGRTEVSVKMTSSILDKFYLCNIVVLQLVNQHITYDEFQYLIKSVEELNFNNTSVYYNEVNVVPLHKIVESVPKLLSLAYSFTPRAAEINNISMDQLTNIPQFKQLNSITFSEIPEIFDFERFCVFMNKNMHIRFNLHFQQNLSRVYTLMIKQFMKSMERMDYGNNPRPICWSNNQIF